MTFDDFGGGAKNAKKKTPAKSTKKAPVKSKAKTPVGAKKAAAKKKDDDDDDAYPDLPEDFEDEEIDEDAAFTVADEKRWKDVIFEEFGVKKSPAAKAKTPAKARAATGTKRKATTSTKTPTTRGKRAAK